MKLSDRQHAALLALADLSVRVTGNQLAEAMRVYRAETSVSAAHQAGNGLDNKGLAMKRYTKDSPVQYEITKQGAELAAQIRPAG